MDSEGGEGRPSPCRQTMKIFCNILQAGGVGAWYHIPARQGR